MNTGGTGKRKIYKSLFGNLNFVSNCHGIKLRFIASFLQQILRPYEPMFQRC